MDSSSVALGKKSTRECQSTVVGLGVIIDNQLTLKDHVRRTCIACFYQLRQLRIVRRSLSSDACASLVQCTCIHSKQVGLLQKFACRHLRHPHSAATVSVACRCKTLKYDPISEIIRDQLHWLSVRHRIDFKLGILVCMRLLIAQ